MLNRNAVRNALTEYIEAKRQSKEILKDKEIQTFFKLEENEKAMSLISRRYPEGQNRNVNNKGLALVEVMVKNLPEWRGIDPMDVYTDIDSFDKLIELAKRV